MIFIVSGDVKHNGITESGSVQNRQLSSVTHHVSASGNVKSRTEDNLTQHFYHGLQSEGPFY